MDDVGIKKINLSICMDLKSCPTAPFLPFTPIAVFILMPFISRSFLTSAWLASDYFGRRCRRSRISGKCICSRMCSLLKVAVSVQTLLVLVCL